MKRLLILPLALAAALAGGAAGIVQDVCGPFTDVSPALCPFVLELYYLGITVGTSATTFSPDDSLTRGQGAVFITKGVNQSLARSSRRAALGQWWTTAGPQSVGLTDVGGSPQLPVADGQDIWVPNQGYVSRVRASDGRLLETWTTATATGTAVVAMGRVFVTGTSFKNGQLYMIDPTEPPGAAVAVATGLGAPYGVAFDGSRIWTTNFAGTVSIFTPGDWSHTEVSEGFVSPRGILYDGANVWIADGSPNALLRLDREGMILQTVSLAGSPGQPVFDGVNIWIPIQSFPDSITVIRASTGAVVATLTDNGLDGPYGAAFDGERILVANANVFGTKVSLWRAADLSPLGFFDVATESIAYGVCSDGIHFFITLPDVGQLARF